ncbi:MAG: globin domain-containing protein [Caldilineaceae bacterium]
MLNPTLLLIERSYQQIESNADQITDYFFQRLFELEPALKLLLPGEPQVRKAFVLTALSFIIDNLHQLDVMHLRAQALGHSWVSKGILPIHYEAMRRALLESFNQLQSGSIAPQAKVAWNEICTMLANTMKRAAEIELNSAIPLGQNVVKSQLNRFVGG